MSMNANELLYRDAQQAAQAGQGAEAHAAYEQLLEQVTGGRLRALVLSDLGTLATLRGNLRTATQYFESALVTDSDCRSARLNLEAIGAGLPTFEMPRNPARSRTRQSSGDCPLDPNSGEFGDKHRKTPP